MPTIYITCPQDEADEVASTLVEERLVACVNAVDCRSKYWWDGNIQHDHETILLCKTTDTAYTSLVERVHEIHPHEVPCIERFDTDDIDPAFASWIDEMVDHAG